MRTAQAILIVGGGLGIGFEITKAILATAGTEVLVFGLHFDEKFGALERLSRTRIIRVQGDVTCPRERQEAMDVCVRVFGGIDTLVYCAGVIGPIERIDKVDIESVKKTFDVNVFGAIAMVCPATTTCSMSF
jgi:NAD(P)-dependent dehydrogenase (short-subunit alcohol dehydrogenase family)